MKDPHFRMPHQPITMLLRQWASGSREAADELLPLVYQDLKVLSRRMLNRESANDATATSLVHDLYLKLAPLDSINWTDRRHFFCFSARLMRQILIDQARSRHANPVLRAGAVEDLPWLGSVPDDYVELNAAMQELEAHDAEKAQAIELRFFMGCTSTETAEIMGLSKATVDRHVNFAKAYLYRRLRGAN
jgi:RNA polymerase sigma factor (TIGR02999 family)